VLRTKDLCCLLVETNCFDSTMLARCELVNREQQTAILRADVQLSVMNKKCKRTLQLKSPQWTLKALIPEPCLHKLCEVSCALFVFVKT